MHHLSKVQIESLLNAAKVSERDYAMILLAYMHGLRASEVTSLTPENFKDGFITVQRLKGSKKTSHPLFPVEAEVINNILKTKCESERLFPVSRVHFWRIVRKHSKAAGIPSHLGHTHVLKHSCAMTGLKGGMKLPELQTYLGHKSGASTMEYLKVDDDTASNAFAEALK